MTWVENGLIYKVRRRIDYIWLNQTCLKGTGNVIRSPFIHRVTCLIHKCTVHPGLIRVRSIRFILFEIQRVLVYNLTINLQICALKRYMPTKKYWRKKAKQLYIMGEIVIESHNFMEYWQTFKSTWS